MCLFSLVSDDKKEPESLSGCEVLLSEPSFAADNESKSQEEECVVVICKSEKYDLPPRVFKGIYLASSRINQQDGVCSVPMKRNLYGNFRQALLKFLTERCSLKFFTLGRVKSNTMQSFVRLSTRRTTKSGSS